MYWTKSFRCSSLEKKRNENEGDVNITVILPMLILYQINLFTAFAHLEQSILVPDFEIEGNREG